MVTPPEYEVHTVAIGGDSLKVTLVGLADVTDWSTLEVSYGTSGIANQTRRTNTLYFKGIAVGETLVTVSFEGSERMTFKLVVTN
ncbi:putative capsid assembly protein [Pectobacterium phage PP74]|uniref:Putative capsid assembly protein n=1 Tax=Pectobacterium phage PP74 TaxID=1916101 RepID=A0A1J0MEQ0_9CAUD|nr:putative capsid assembly protein [Pectobacterium phage PP74]APD19647.1 putative capsid assembly protein [Pectobacterium phage PP74]